MDNAVSDMAEDWGQKPVVTIQEIDAGFKIVTTTVGCMGRCVVRRLESWMSGNGRYAPYP